MDLSEEELLALVQEVDDEMGPRPFAGAEERLQQALQARSKGDNDHAFEYLLQAMTTLIEEATSTIDEMQDRIETLQSDFDSLPIS
jgi:hypothetical protein